VTASDARLRRIVNDAVPVEDVAVGAWIMLGTLFGLIVLIFALVLRFDPEARGPSKNKGPDRV
jgi:hypothetical protein